MEEVNKNGELQNTDEKLHISDVNFNDLKKYCDYLIEQYKKINNSHYEGSGIYWELKQFSEEGEINNLIKKSDITKLKIGILNYIRKDIVNFAKEWDINIKVLSFEDFLNH